MVNGRLHAKHKISYFNDMVSDTQTWQAYKNTWQIPSEKLIQFVLTNGDITVVVFQISSHKFTHAVPMP